MTDITRPTRPDLSCDDVRELAASFVLGALDDSDADAVRAHLASCADPHAEMAELGSVVSVLAEMVPVVEPSAALKDRIMAAAAADLEERTRAAAPAEVITDGAAVPTPFPGATQREQRAAVRTGMGTWLLRIAAVLAIALVGGWNLMLQDALRTTQARLEAAGDYERSVAAVLEGAAQPGSLTAILTGEGTDDPAGLASVLRDGTVRIAMRDLPATSGDQVYEAWVIGGDGVPVALGSFKVGATGTAYFEGGGLPTEPGIVLALTLEPAPGATAPTTTPVSVGVATAAG